LSSSTIAMASANSSVSVKFLSFSCSIAYLLAQNSGIEPRLCNGGDINECNISGTWQHYDQEIEFACHFYDSKYHFFKNVFCYMCNPPLYDSGISISEWPRCKSRHRTIEN
jgi:hypothetical protein